MTLRRWSETRWRRGMAGFLAALGLISPLAAAPKSPPRNAERKARPAVVAEPAPKPAVVAKPVAKPSDADDLYEGPASARPPAPRPVVRLPAPKRPSELSAPHSSGPKYADAWPSEYRKPELDLRLTAEAENRAEAVAEYVRGHLAEMRGDADEALEAWKRASALDPANGELVVKVARELAKRNEPGEAIRLLKDAIAVTPKEPQTHIYLAQIYAKHLNKPDLAMQVAQRAVEVAPEYFPAWAAVFDLLEQGADKKKAGELLDKALKSESKDAEFWLQLGGFLRKAFLKEDEPVPPEDLRRMETAFRKAAELKPHDASVLAQVGDFFALARDEKQALEFYERAVKLNQAATDEATKNLREKHIRALIKNQRIAEAIPLLEQLAKDPSGGMRHDLFEFLGELYQQAGQMDKAIEHYKQSLVLDAGEPRNHLYLANVLMKAKRFEDAVAIMEQARLKFPDRPHVAYFLASALARAKRHQEAMAVFAKLQEEARGRDESLLDEDFYFQWGAVAEQAGDMEKAAEMLKKAIAINPNSAEPYNYLGYMWVDKGVNLEEAGELIKRAVEMEPKNGAYLDSMGWYYFKVGKFDEARRWLFSALDALKAEGKEEDPVVLEHLADAYEKLGNFREAVSFWERALKQEAENPDQLREKIAAAKKKAGR